MIKHVLRRARRLPGVSAVLDGHQLAKRIAEQEHELNEAHEELLRLLQTKETGAAPPALTFESVDMAPWRHPYLTRQHIKAFRTYSERVWAFALEYQRAHPTPLRAAFTVNMCQNMYKWARLAKTRGADVELFPHVMDTTALSRPEWEEFDGEYDAVLDAAGFLAQHGELRPEVACSYVPITTEGSDLLGSWVRFLEGEPDAFVRLQSEFPGIRHEALLTYAGFYTYYSWAKRLATFDVAYGCSNPFAAYASGRPYLVFSVGGDLIFDCGKRDDFGRAHLVAFNAARFLTVSNPHTLAHCRRLGLTNGVYLPYPMDDRKYSPGHGRARAEWIRQFGEGVYVLAPSRIDAVWKGFDQEMLEQLRAIAQAHPEVRFVFLGWGENQQEVRDWIQASGVASNFIVLKPVGKARLIDYYRSCDIVLDHFVLGYYGATALEAASIGRPIVMKLRSEHYEPLYVGDVAPVDNVSAPKDLFDVLSALVVSRPRRLDRGQALREWLVRTHGEDRTMPLLLALMRVAADEVPLPRGLENPLRHEVSEEEREYHATCVRPRAQAALP